MKGRALFTGMVAIIAIFALIIPAIAQDNQAEQNKQTEDPIATLRKLLQEHPEAIPALRALLDQLEKGKALPPGQKPAEEPDIPGVILPGAAEKPEGGQPGQGRPSPASGTARASLIPDISVIGNNLGRFISRRGDPDRNRFQLGEFEIGLQQPIFPGIRFDAFLTAGADERFSLSAEEAYATFSKIGHLPFGGYLGEKRLNFGKINPVHPHARLYADAPAAINYLLGGDGLSGNGAAINYLLPIKGIFANLDLGLWKTDPAEEGVTIPNPGGNFYPIGLGVKDNFASSRLWLSKAFSKGSELEAGVSHGFGRADIGDRINLTGLDFTYRMFPTTFSRFLVQGEAFWHHRNDVVGGTGGHTRAGQYLLLSYRPDQYYDYGIRLDNTKLPWPFDGREQSISLIWSDRMTEVTLLRFQLKYGDRTSDIFLPAARGYKEAWLQFIWGGGSHTHPLQ